MIPNGNNDNEGAAGRTAKKDPERQDHHTATPLLHLGGPMIYSTVNSGFFNRRANPLNLLPAEFGRPRSAKLSNTRLFLS